MRTIRAALLTIGLALLAVLTVSTTPALAQHGGRGRGVVVVGGGFYDPFWDPYYYPPYGYPHPYGYGARYDRTADVRLMVTPKEAQVYVDGYYMGIVDNFDGVFQRLSVEPGDHEIVLYLQGYRSVHERVNLTAHSTTKLRYAMERLGPGEVSEQPPQPMPRAEAPADEPQAPQPPVPRRPRTGRPALPPPPQGPARPEDRPEPPAAREAGEYGTLAIRVQPAGARILVDGEPWHTSDPQSALLVQVPAGRHHVEVTRDGYRPFSIDVTVRPGATVPVNVSLSSERQED